MRQFAKEVMLLVVFLVPGLLATQLTVLGAIADVPHLAVPQEAEETASDSFRRNVVQAAVKLRQEGKISMRDVVKLRVAMFSPAFREHAEELAIVQMSASGSDAVGGDSVPLGTDGKIDRANIDWDALLAFIEKLIPLILQLIDAFSDLTGYSQAVYA